MDIPIPLLGLDGRASCAVPRRRTVWWAERAGRGPGLTVIVVEGSNVPGSVWPAAVVVCGGWMTGRGDVDKGLDRLVLDGCLYGGGGRWWEGGVGCGGWGVLPWVRAWVRVVSLGLVSLCLWCCGLRGVVLVVVLLLVVRSFGRRLGFGVGFLFGVRFEVAEDLSLEV